MGKYDPWDAFFAELNGDEVSLALDDFEKLGGVELPPSARQHAAWWSSGQHHAKWRAHGWRASPKLGQGSVRFSRVTSIEKPAHPESSTSAHGGDSISPTNRLILVGCVATKADQAAPAKDLYRSAMWRKRRTYAEAAGGPWAILSSEYGLVMPDEVIEPYDRFLASQPGDFRRRWADETARNVVSLCRNLGCETVEIHAGAAYADGLEERLSVAGVEVLRPLRGLRQGEQLAWYAPLQESTQPVESASVAIDDVVSVVVPLLEGKPGLDRTVAIDRIVDRVNTAARWITDGLERMKPAASMTEPEDSEFGSQVAVVDGLLRHAAELEARGESRISPVFTDNEAANAFLLSDDWAFLAAVICDYQILAERAWEAPYQLDQRLGSWSVEFVASNPDEVETAFVQRPSLHRFPTQTARWVVEAANRVIEHYGGDTGTVWNDEPTARELQRRLGEFSGISQKKAAMAVEILNRHLGVEIRDLSGSDIAYDVHVRRVMLRSGLADRDDVGHMVEAARRLHPQRPGALDLPMWDIGRSWCRPQNPRCSACAIGGTCPQLIGRGDSVRGA